MNQRRSQSKSISDIKYGLFVTVSIVFIGCSRTTSISASERYTDQMVEVIAKDSVSYKLGSGWIVDSFQNVSGRGLKVIGDSSESFRGTIQSTNIKQLKVVDNVTPAIVVCIGAIIALISLLLNT